jgi:hypothetical protein
MEVNKHESGGVRLPLVSAARKMVYNESIDACRNTLVSAEHHFQVEGGKPVLERFNTKLKAKTAHAFVTFIRIRTGIAPNKISD